MQDCKRLFVVSDVHGCYTIMRQALDRAGFDPENEEHLFICCGDLFDRGQENRQVFEFVRSLAHKVLVCGNHDARMCELLRTRQMTAVDVRNGTDITLAELFGLQCMDDYGQLYLMRNEKLAYNLNRLLHSAVDYFETEHYIFVHGWVPTRRNQAGRIELRPDWRSADRQSWNAARLFGWQTLYGINDMIPEKTIVCGHRGASLASIFDPSRADTDTSIYYGEKMIALDAGAPRSGRLNVLVLPERVSLT